MLRPRRTSKTRDRDEGPERPQSYIPLHERAARRVDAFTVAALGVVEEKSVSELIKTSELRSKNAEGAFPPLNEDGARRLLKEAQKLIDDEIVDPDRERKRMGAALKSQIPLMFGSKKYGEAIRAMERYSRLYGLDAPKVLKIDPDGHKAVLEALGLSTVEELAELVKRGLSEDDDDD